MDEKHDHILLDIERRNGEIVVLRAAGILLHKGSDVISRGNFLVPRGTCGKVVAIKEPYTDGYTTDVVVCVFDGQSGTFRMKPGELAEPATHKTPQ